MEKSEIRNNSAHMFMDRQQARSGTNDSQLPHHYQASWHSGLAKDHESNKRGSNL